MAIVIFLTLLVLSLSQNCSTVSPYCTTCSYVYTAISCTACSGNAFSTPMIVNGTNYTVNGTSIWTCKLCSIANTGCLSCSSATSLTYGIYCNSCSAGYGIPYGIWGCQICPSNCLACNAYTTGMGSACGASIPTASCGTNGLVCSQCATDYTLGSIDYNCYYCPTVSTNCLVNSCSQVALGVFSCSSCAIGYYKLPTIVNGTNYTVNDDLF